MLSLVTRLLVISCVLAVVPASASRADDDGIWRAGARVDIDVEGQKDIAAAGASVKIRGGTTGNIWAAGALVDIDAVAGKEVWVAGSRVTVKGRVGESIHGVGAEIDVAGRVAGETHLAGASVRIGEEAVLTGAVEIAGANVDYRGRSMGELELAGDEVTVAGQAEGAVTIRARSVRILETARIGGNLTIYSADKPQISPQAQIDGRLASRGLDEAEWSMEEGYGPLALGFLMPPLIIGISAFLLGLLAIWLTRGSVEQVIDTIMVRPGGSALRGFLALVLVALAAILLMVVLIGLPLGFALLLVIPVMLILGFAAAGFGLGEWLLNRAGEPKRAGGRLLLLALGVLVLALLSLIPIVGGLILLIAVFMGLGAVVLTLGDRLSPERPAGELGLMP